MYGNGMSFAEILQNAVKESQYIIDKYTESKIKELDEYFEKKLKDLEDTSE